MAGYLVTDAEKTFASLQAAGRCMTDVEVLHATRVHPDGDPLAHYRDQLQRLISAASRDGVILFVGPEQVAQAVRRPEAAA